MIDGKKIGAVIPAAGAGRRMGGPRAKQFLALDGKPILARTVERFDSSPEVDEIVLAVGEEEREAVAEMLRPYAFAKLRRIVAGGAERQDSVWNALAAVSCDVAIVHDAVRPFVSHALIGAVASAALKTGAAIACVPPKETIKLGDGAGSVLSTPDRRLLWVAQTPQAFAYTLLVEAFRQAQKERFYGTDDASLVERLGVKVSLVEGYYDNIKITTPEDMDTAARILSRLSVEGRHLVF
jgi:2-C-methyl-D-erythritol 4-phosphate cytidylyltransferase